MAKFKSFFPSNANNDEIDRYQSIMDAIPENLRDIYRYLGDDEDFYLEGQLFEGKDFPEDPEAAMEQYKKDKLEMILQFIDNPTEEQINEIMRSF